MQIKESVVMAFDSLTNNKLRTVLTLLGISIGLFSIIIVMTAIGAIQKSVEDTFNSIGTNNFIIQKYPAINVGGHGSWRKYRNRKDLTVEMGERLIDMTSLPQAIGLQLDRGGRVVKYGNESTNPDVELIGVNLDEFIVSDRVIGEGRGFTKQDIEYSRNICILGTDIVDKLFPSIYPIGEEIRVGNLSLEVVGILEKKGSVLGASQDNFVIIPITLFTKTYGDSRSGNYTIMAPSAELTQATMDEVIGALRVIRKVKPGEENDFEIITNDQLIDQFNDITQYFKLGAAVIAFIALVAAGIGIMNIMLVSVSERTKEIGIRKAIGAKRSYIRSQFVIEAIVLSQIGGLIGIILGVLGGNLVAVTLGVSVILPVEWILLGLTITTLVGVTFGAYPAFKASNLDPIEALRYE
ncbi:MAG: ABC transporter permease [Melioribacteraceae bacterium]|nr:ABC transporter permease [Melioribacteraceae bacterium]MCF8355481.1 ABC transporter permease [Melioribacteraceae bacterium]MCF8394906.1 ABC transporter permease [Melioribacteraceae bacterium]MCF8420452.1 ABC transporter permease [Melioribacteraceae bacterium]